MADVTSATSGPRIHPASSFRPPSVLLIVGGAVGLLASFVLSVDKVRLLENKIAGRESAFNCDLSPFVNCSNVMGSHQSAIFGFPNSFIGILGFAVVLTLGVLWLDGTAVRRWVWFGLQAGTVFGIGFVTWLQFQSIYRIGFLCPYCMVVWAVMIPIFVFVTGVTLRMLSPDGAVTRFVTNWTALIVSLWYVAVAAAIWFRFGANLWA